MKINNAAGEKVNPATEEALENLAAETFGRWGFVFITGNAEVVAPDGLCFASIECQTDGVILEALKKDAAKTIVDRGVAGEGTFPAAEKALKQDKWYPFLQKITSIKLKGATDEVIAWYKPL